MTAPTWNNFQLLIAGWVFARRRTVTGMIEAAGQMGMKHHSLFHRVFAKARWSLDRLGLALFDLLRPCCGETVFLVVDDTLANKRGRKVFGTGMHYDPMLSSRSVKVTRWAHSVRRARRQARLGRAGSHRTFPVVARAAVLFADSVSTVPE